jgi:hypothetical protein
MEREYSVYGILVWICVTQVDSTLCSTHEELNGFQVDLIVTLQLIWYDKLAFRFYITN